MGVRSNTHKTLHLHSGVHWDSGNTFWAVGHANTWGFLEVSKDVAVYRLWIMANLGLHTGKQRGEAPWLPMGRKGVREAGAAARKPEVQGTGFLSWYYRQAAKQNLHAVHRREGLSQGRGLSWSTEDTGEAGVSL